MCVITWISSVSICRPEAPWEEWWFLFSLILQYPEHNSLNKYFCPIVIKGKELHNVYIYYNIVMLCLCMYLFLSTSTFLICIKLFEKLFCEVFLITMTADLYGTSMKKHLRTSNKCDLYMILFYIFSSPYFKKRPFKAKIPCYTHSVKWKWNTITPPCPLGSIGAWNQYHHYLKYNQTFFPISVTCCHLHLQLHDTSLSHTCFLHISAKFTQPSRLIQGSLLSWIGLKLE